MTTLDITNEDNRTAARRVNVYALSRVCVCVCVCKTRHTKLHSRCTISIFVKKEISLP